MNNMAILKFKTYKILSKLKHTDIKFYSALIFINGNSNTKTIFS